MIIRANTCHHCGHGWTQISQKESLPEKPVKCPKCKSKKWDVVWSVVPVNEREKATT